MRALRTMNEDQTRHWREAVEAERREGTDIDADLEAFELGAAENSFSGHLQKAIHGSGVPLTLVLARTDVEWVTLRPFLAGEGSLPSDAIDRIATTLHLDCCRIPANGASDAETSHG
ncbi:MAG: hypothetical protein SFV23_26535 [Planctomycetaceae bacterium]|nr:hypothetical protein [Planctomycetaceae bacterium]